MKIIFLSGVLFLMVSSGAAQFYDFSAPSSVGLGMSGAGDTTAWSFFSNPSGFSNPSEPVAGIGYNNAYGLKALSSKAVFIHYPAKLVTASAGYVHYGSSLFNMQRFSAGFSRQISPMLHLGLRFGYILRSIQGEESAGTFLADAGIRFLPSESLQIGILAQNPSQAEIKTDNDTHLLPSNLAMALTWQSSPLFSVTGDICQQLHAPLMVYAFGVAANVHRQITLKGMVSGKPVRLALGAALQWQSIRFDISVNHHHPLGFSSSAGISYLFSTKK